MATMQFRMADYREARERRSLRVVYRVCAGLKLYYVGFGEWSDDRDAAIRYDPRDTPWIPGDMKAELA